MMYSYGGYGMPGYGAGGYSGSCGSGYAGWGIRWIYALLVLIVIVLQFARKPVPAIATTNACGDDGVTTTGAIGNGFFDGELIDRSVLFIIVVFLLILCTGCWTGGFANYGSAGFGGGYGY